MKRLIAINVAWNSIFVLMMISELTGATSVHEWLPWYAKWWWGIGLASGNLIIHAFMWSKAGWMIESVNLRQRDDGAARDWSPP